MVHPPHLSSSDLQFLFRLAEQHAGIRLCAARATMLEARLWRVVRDEGFGDFRGLVAALRSNPLAGVLAPVLDALATPETSFFRDEHVFEHLAAFVIPTLLERRARGRKLSIWSAACSTGQEPYSVAMMLCERFPELEGWKVSVLASDLSAELVRRAKEGLYTGAEVVRGLTANRRSKHYERVGSAWRVRPEVARRVEFRVQNLVKPWGSVPSVDLVLMRNVLIYFGDDAKRSVLHQTAAVTAPDGFLVLAPSEIAGHLTDEFRIVDSAVGLHANRREGGALEMAG
jgi:chemotaxis protein methyltransferase CheR